MLITHEFPHIIQFPSKAMMTRSGGQLPNRTGVAVPNQHRRLLGRYETGSSSKLIRRRCNALYQPRPSHPLVRNQRRRSQ